LREYNYLDNWGMRRKTSITLPPELLERLDRVDRNRSALLERAAEAYLKALARQERDRRDIAIIDRNADRLNREAADVLDYQKLR
jgi:metal-responsive CopG/Arc/MetJ family transcriptional regulator